MIKSPFYFKDSVLASHRGQAQTEEFGDASMDILCHWLHLNHVTIFQEKTKLYVSCMYL